MAGQHAASHDDDASTMRIDKWLWAARFFKTRAIAADAVDGGKVHLNGERVKRAKSLRVGDALQIRLGPYEHRVVVRELSERRGPATEAVALYEERAESVAERERLQAQRRLEATRVAHDAGRPNKRERRQLDELRHRRD